MRSISDFYSMCIAKILQMSEKFDLQQIGNDRISKVTRDSNLCIGTIYKRSFLFTVLFEYLFSNSSKGYPTVLLI